MIREKFGRLVAVLYPSPNSKFEGKEINVALVAVQESQKEKRS